MKDKFEIFLGVVILLIPCPLVLGVFGLLVDMVIQCYTGHSLIREFIRPLFN